VPVARGSHRARRRDHQRGTDELRRLDFLYAVTDDGPPASGADRAGFIDLAPERDVPQYPGLPADFPRTCPSAADAQDNLGAFPLTGDIAIENP
jgi:hypothetical protein